MFCQTVAICAGLHNITRYISDTILHRVKKTVPNFPERNSLCLPLALDPHSTLSLNALEKQMGVTPQSKSGHWHSIGKMNPTLRTSRRRRENPTNSFLFILQIIPIPSLSLQKCDAQRTCFLGNGFLHCQ